MKRPLSYIIPASKGLCPLWTGVTGDQPGLFGKMKRMKQKA